MARPLRIEYEGALYHVTSRGNERRKIYFSPSDYEKFLEYIKEAEEKYGILLHVYVLMTNHYHLIIETPEGNLSRAMHHINGSYTTYINNKRKRSGHLFQGRYRAIVVDKDSYLIELSRYIHLNPVRAGLVETPEDYPYSSYKAYISNKNDDGINGDIILGMISGDKVDASKRYKEFVESAIGADMESPLKHTYGGIILGREGFIKDVLKRLKKEHLLKEETSHRRTIKSLYGIEEILNAIAGYFNSKNEDIVNNTMPKARKIAIYLMKKHTRSTNRQIGKAFGSLSYSGVAKVYVRFLRQMEQDKAAGKIVRQIEENLSKVKG